MSQTWISRTCHVTFLANYQKLRFGVKKNMGPIRSSENQSPIPNISNMDIKPCLLIPNDLFAFGKKIGWEKMFNVHILAKTLQLFHFTAFLPIWAQFIIECNMFRSKYPCC